MVLPSFEPLEPKNCFTSHQEIPTNVVLVSSTWFGIPPPASSTPSILWSSASFPRRANLLFNLWAFLGHSSPASRRQQHLYKCPLFPHFPCARLCLCRPTPWSYRCWCPTDRWRTARPPPPDLQRIGLIFQNIPISGFFGCNGCKFGSRAPAERPGTFFGRHRSPRGGKKGCEAVATFSCTFKDAGLLWTSKDQR